MAKKGVNGISCRIGSSRRDEVESMMGSSEAG